MCSEVLLYSTSPTLNAVPRKADFWCRASRMVTLVLVDLPRVSSRIGPVLDPQGAQHLFPSTPGPCLSLHLQIERRTPNIWIIAL
jgi:hypothetical protein